MKKSFYKIAFSGFLTLAAFCTVLYSCSKKDACDSIVCQNNAPCASGACTCPSGYSGTNCENLTSIDPLLKPWSAHWQNVDDATKNGSYSSTISQGAIANSIRLSTFFDLFVNPVTATVSGNDITIPTQSPDGTYVVSGTGRYTNLKIVFIYSITNGGTIKNYTDTFQ